MKKQPHILVIDDDQFYLDHAKFELKGHATYQLFQGPNDFEERVKKEDIDKADLVIVDYDFGTGTAIKSQISRFIRDDLGYAKELVLCSLHETFGDHEDRVKLDYDHVLQKKDLNWGKISSILT
ncbi:MAG: hypothetical protein AB8G05_23180 [Oligoflexales bacterium]